eukprot:Phypoly_transcript_22806.p1 GENE.Phypoly_transcript_22806~~Phypoly_transcript_22806.p1  ORF type:complete len:166 (+),score=18.87 Phypoly_transcript_22806:25-498(+)
MDTCTPNPLTNTSVLLKQDSPFTFSSYHFSDVECTDIVESDTFTLGECTKIQSVGPILLSAIYTVSPVWSVNVKGPAFQRLSYVSCNSPSPFEAYIYNPDLCMLGNITSALSVPTCTTTTYTVREWDNPTTCSGGYNDVVNPFPPCDSGVTYGCYGL